MFIWIHRYAEMFIQIAKIPKGLKLSHFLEVAIIRRVLKDVLEVTNLEIPFRLPAGATGTTNH